jgi:hypothetical protein
LNNFVVIKNGPLEGRVRKMEMSSEAGGGKIGSEISKDETNLAELFELFFFTLAYLRNVSAQLPH